MTRAHRLLVWLLYAEVVWFLIQAAVNPADRWQAAAMAVLGLAALWVVIPDGR